MNSFEFIVNKTVPLSFEGFLFNEPRLINSKDYSETYTFHFKRGELSFARFNLFVKGTEGHCNLMAPFGSVEFDSSLKFEELDFFIDKILTFCKAKNLKNLFITSYPQSYALSNSELLTYVLILNKFIIKVADLNYHIQVSSFKEGLHLSERRRLKKSQGQDYSFSMELKSLKQVYQLIQDSRNSKGYPVSMTENDFYDLFQKFPNDYVLFTLWDKEVLIASAVGVRVNSKILYYFLPADHIDYRAFSPSVLLINKMVEFCEEKKIEILDLGIATSAGIPNKGLIRFKENMGGIPSLKFHFIKDLSS